MHHAAVGGVRHVLVAQGRPFMEDRSAGELPRLHVSRPMEWVS
jgi:hypothetical protein